MNAVKGKDSPGVGMYQTPNFNLSHSVTGRGIARISEKRFEEERLRLKKYKNT